MMIPLVVPHHSFLDDLYLLIVSLPEFTCSSMIADGGWAGRAESAAVPLAVSCTLYVLARLMYE
jgi:hypothetical protein